MRRILTVFLCSAWTLALSIFALSACGHVEPDPDPEPINILDLINPDGQAVRGLTVDSKAMGKTMKYNVWLPPKFDANTAYPILYLLHGAGDDQNAWLDKGNAMQIAAKYVKTGGKPMIIVMPDAQMTFYVGAFEKYFHEELMPTVEAKYKFSGKRAVAGLSMGGYGTLYHALKYPAKFTYAYAMSPAVDVTSFKALIDAQSDKKVFPPFTIEVGTEDTTVSNADAETVANYMKEKGLTCEWIARSGIHYWNFWQECLPKALKKAGETF
jgi:enterochelin esterase-like enzyme